MKKNNKGFTLIELLIVIGVIAILAAIIYVAVDPARRFAEARNAERWASVNSILNAYLKYTVDNAGTAPTSTIDTSPHMIATGNDATNCAAIATSHTIDLSNLVDTYLARQPYDSSAGGTSSSKTYYYLVRSGNGRVTIGSCEPETVGGSTPTIKVTR